jgi:hypothetical protein
MDLLHTAAQDIDLHTVFTPTLRAMKILARLNNHQLSELSRDVYDELLRRNLVADAKSGRELEKQVPAFLLPCDSFHPKRNQERQKLATLADDRFKALLRDVLSEINKRAGARIQGVAAKLEGIKEEQENKWGERECKS